MTNKSKIKLSCFFLILISTQLFAQSMSDILPKSYIANYTTDTFKIDGIANEAQWKDAPWTDEFIDIEGVKTPKYKTKIKMLWDDEYFYFYAELEEPHIWGDITKRDAVIFYNNDFEIFMDPDGDSHNYMEFEINALNTVWDLFLTKPYRNGNKILNNWDINGMKTAIFIDGTLNDSSDRDSKWTVEIALPWSVLLEGSSSTSIPKNEYWRVNFSRVNWDFEVKDGKYTRKKDPKTKKPLPEYNWVWSPQGVINMHEPEKWGYVFFAENEKQKKSFQLTNDEYIRLQLFNIYNKQRKYYSKNKKWNKDLFPKSLLIKETTINITTETTKTSYVLSVKSPFTNKTLFINNEGKLTAY
ncbi:MAG: carbohydrate-binding family 9-like protein [Bacteroidetes bacterium MedPE-SWsnd-G1]|nr:MAG: carbohydrate-binding family 9-like protein [Bacteroidetes bacterium MedPE-SWsnd-G1]